MYILSSKEKRKKYIKKEKRKVEGSAPRKKYYFNFLFLFYILKMKKTVQKLDRSPGFLILCYTQNLELWKKKMIK